MFGHVFIHTASNDEPLEQFASLLFERLGITRFHERESSNYVEGFYFLGTAFGIEGALAYADEQGLPDYRFWLSIEPVQHGAPGGDYLHQHALSLAALLSTFGWRTFVPNDFCTVAGDHEGTVFPANSNATGNV